MDELLQSIGNFGFPMVISAYLLIRVEGKLEQVARRLSEISAIMRAARREENGIVLPPCAKTRES